jgi:hypothetical protein
VNKQDYRDYFVLGAVTVSGLLACAFLFMYPSSVNFATWSGFEATLFGTYHWLTVSDDKRVDAGNVAAVLPTEGLASEFRDWTGGHDAGTS